jgi:hypothetical protein
VKSKTNKTEWGGDVLPARLRPEEVAHVLGFNPEDMRILVGKRLLKPLGKPRPNAAKFFASVEVKEKINDVNWLHKATNTIYEYWRGRNERKKSSQFKLAA